MLFFLKKQKCLSNCDNSMNAVMLIYSIDNNITKIIYSQKAKLFSIINPWNLWQVSPDHAWLTWKTWRVETSQVQQRSSTLIWDYINTPTSHWSIHTFLSVWPILLKLEKAHRTIKSKPKNKSLILYITCYQFQT